MRQGCVVVLDIGKTLAKLTLWSPERQLIERRIRRNVPAMSGGYPALDVRGISAWLTETLTAFARLGDIAAIVPVGHGAAACVVGDEGWRLASIDYEAEPPTEVRMRYAAMRDPFALTGSPSLPAGLNLGTQLLWLEDLEPDKFAHGRIVTWPQYWSWRLCGVAATEVTSLGCHTDLWVPAERRPSPMAVAQGWADRLAPMRHAAEVLGPIRDKWRDRCKLPADCMVLCGLHDSNAALYALRGYTEVGVRDFTILSTGTWFVAMRSISAGTAVNPAQLPESRDCLVNVDVDGLPVPSARFMGGREAELIEQAASSPVDVKSQANLLVRTAEAMIREGALVLPTFQKGVGPFPKSNGCWIEQPSDQISRRALAGLYLALVANVSLELIGSRGPIVIEGRFADDPVFTGALAALQEQPVFLSNAQDSLAFGALRLIDPELPAQAELARANPLECGLAGYAARWRTMAQDAKAA